MNINIHLAYINNQINLKITFLHCKANGDGNNTVIGSRNFKRIH